MENSREQQMDAAVEEKEEGYIPRPVWQVWGARIALVVFLIFVVYQLLSVARGGL